MDHGNEQDDSGRDLRGVLSQKDPGQERRRPERVAFHEVQDEIPDGEGRCPHHPGQRPPGEGVLVGFHESSFGD